MCELCDVFVMCVGMFGRCMHVSMCVCVCDVSVYLSMSADLVPIPPPSIRTRQMHSIYSARYGRTATAKGPFNAHPLVHTSLFFFMGKIFYGACIFA